MARAKKSTTKGEPATLEVLPVAQFATHKAVRAFVSSRDFQCLMLLVSEAADPTVEEPPCDALLQRAREAAGFLARDLTEIAALSAGESRDFQPPRKGRGWYFSNRAAWLGLLLAAARSDDWTEYYANGMAEAVATQLERIGDEEAEEWRAAKRGAAA